MRGLRLHGSTRFQVLFHSPRRGAFHRSLTVLVRYRSLRVSSLGAWSPLLHAGLLVSGATQGRVRRWRVRCDYAALTRSGAAFQSASSPGRASGGTRQGPVVSPCYPTTATAAPLARSWFRLTPVRSPLLRGCCLFLGVLRCFSSPGALRSERCPSATDGLPHSEIVGSQPARGSPTLIAALPRPSSARSAEASSVCSSCLPWRNAWHSRSRTDGVTRRRRARCVPVVVFGVAICTW